MEFTGRVSISYAMAFCYLISLLPVFLPWRYFDEEIDGINMEQILLAVMFLLFWR
jgi:hypothetical protein